MRAKAMQAQKNAPVDKDLGPIMEEGSGQQPADEVNKKHEDIKKRAALMASKKRRQLGKQSVLQESMMSSTTKMASSEVPTEDISDTVSVVSEMSSASSFAVQPFITHLQTRELIQRQPSPEKAELSVDSNEPKELDD